MAAADPLAASITGLGETLQNLISINTAGFAGIQVALQKTNNLLEKSLGKNLKNKDLIFGFPVGLNKSVGLNKVAQDFSVIT